MPHEPGDGRRGAADGSGSRDLRERRATRTPHTAARHPDTDVPAARPRGVDCPRFRSPLDALPRDLAGALLEALIGHCGGLVLVYDRESTVLWASEHLLALMELDAAQLGGRAARDFVGPAAREALAASLAGRPAYSAGLVHAPPFEGSHPLRCVWLPLTDARGDVLGGAAVACEAAVPGPARAAAAGAPPRAPEAAADAPPALARGHVDHLTGLPDRAACTAHLAALSASGGLGAGVLVCLLDLDSFQDVNRELGPQAGDDVLRETAARLRGLVRHGDLVARVGDDEFAVVMPDVADHSRARLLVARLRSALRRPYAVGQREVSLTASCGCVLGQPQDLDAERLCEDAYLALDAARREGGDTCRFFDADLAARCDGGSLALHAALERALAGDELVLRYQPIVELATGRPAGAEALVRWQHPDEGLLPPASFLPVAERSGLIERLGRQVRLLAVAFARRSRHRRGRPLRLGLNVAAREVVRADLAGELSRLVDAASLSPACFELELTETAVLADPERARATMAALRACGFSVALDDFGTGFSSLTHLRELPIDRVKVDRSFVAGLPHEETARAIVGAVIGLAHSLGLEVVAEGVETEAQADMLRAFGCDLAQGFLFGPPLAEEDLAEWVARRLDAV